MQILTKCLIVCVLAATTAPISSHAADTDAQVRAREALRQKIGELDAQAAVTNPPPIAAPKSKPAPEPPITNPTPAPADTVKTAPATPVPAPAIETSSTPPSAPAPVVKTTRKPKPAPVAKTAPASGQYTASRPDSEKVAKARMALEEKMRELNAPGSEPGQPAVASQPPVTRPVVATQAPANPAPPVHRTPEVSSTSQPPSTEMREMTEPLPTPPPVRRTAQPQPKPEVSKKPRQTTPTPEPRPLYALPKGPPPPVSAEKVEKLSILLQQYQADRITPEQYHQERAKILAGP
jgi:hypothetical protein